MKISFEKLFNNKKFLVVFSLLLAILIWLFIAIAVDDEGTKSISKVPIEIDEISTINTVGLELIDIEKETVNVIVKGQRYIIGNITADDISVVPNFSGVTGPGTYDLPLEVTLKGSSQTEIAYVSDKTVEVIFDKLVTKSFEVEVNLGSVTIPEGYIQEECYTTPGEITVTGPEQDVAEIEKCVVNVAPKETLSQTTTIQSEVILLDKDGKEIDSQYITLSDDIVAVVIPVYATKTVPVTFGYINVPQNFPTDQLQYELSISEIEIAGPAEQLERFTELHIGYIDISTIDLDGEFNFRVSLPTGFVNLGNIDSISVKFDTSNMTSKTFYINRNNISLVNRPTEGEVSVITQQITSVKVVGLESIINTMTVNDIVGEIDLSTQELSTGQFRVPVTVHIPSKGLVWAVGDYSAVIQIRAQ